MTIKFRGIGEARRHLLDNGYRFIRFGVTNKRIEIYSASGLVAQLRRVPFGTVEVRIG